MLADPAFPEGTGAALGEVFGKFAAAGRVAGNRRREIGSRLRRASVFGPGRSRFQRARKPVQARRIGLECDGPVEQLECLVKLMFLPPYLGHVDVGTHLARIERRSPS